MTNWKPFDPVVVADEKDEPGVYELANSDDMTVYIGSADRVRDRLWVHVGELPDSCIRRHAVKYRVDYIADYKNQELLMRSLFLDAFGEEPLCNQKR